MTTQTIEPWVETSSGTQFWFLNPQQDQINIKDIAWALSHIPRFGGHARKFVSVAEHSIYVSMLVPPALALEGLLHDGEEAYILDMPTPIKQFMPEYKEMGQKILRAIYTKYMLGMPATKAVKDADKAQMQVEANFLLPSRGETWVNRIEGAKGIEPKGLSQSEAYYKFLEVFNTLWTIHQFNIRKMS